MGIVASLRGRLKFLDRRGAPRIPVTLPADFARSDDAGGEAGEESVFLFHRTVNISRTGAFIHATSPLPVGSAIAVDFTLFSTDAFAAPARRIACAARVINVAPAPAASVPGGTPAPRVTGMGIRFADLSEEDWEAIRAHVTAPKAEGAPRAARMTVALAPPDPEREKRDLEELERLTPELRQEVASFAWQAPRHAPLVDEPESIPEEDLIAEIEQRMSADGPDLRPVRDGDPPPPPPAANFELRSNGIVEAKRARDDLGLVARVSDEPERGSADPIAAIARIVAEPDPAPPAAAPSSAPRGPKLVRRKHRHRR
jgi:hypothetical protein